MGYGNSEETVMAIGSGLYARTRTPLSLLEQYRRLQAGCTHRKRDPRGTCYGWSLFLYGVWTGYGQN